MASVPLLYVELSLLSFCLLHNDASSSQGADAVYMLTRKQWAADAQSQSSACSTAHLDDS